VVQALPVLRLLKQHRPEAQVFWWIESGLAPLLEEDPDLAGLVHFERRRWGVPWRWAGLWRSWRALREEGFDWVIDLQGLARSGLFAWLANGGISVGLDDPREGARGFYDYAVSRPGYDCHAVDWYLRVLSLLGIPVHWRFQWMPERPAVVATLRQKWAPDPFSWVTLLPGARWANKQWPAGYFAELTCLLADRLPHFRFVVLGSAADQAAGRRIHAAAPDRVLDLTGLTSLPEMVEWIRLGAVAVTNDTGPMHVAAAMGKPLIALFGPTDPLRTGPYGQMKHVVRHPLPCVPCLKPVCRWSLPMECLHRIGPEEVARQVLARLGE